MLRRLLVFASLVLSVSAAERPNIIVIMADDLGYSDLGCYGGEIQTPHLDQLAEEGMRMTQFYNTAKSSPTRASLLSGLYHQQTRMLQDTTNHVTLAEVLKSAGYSTMMCGKWGVGWEENGSPVNRGFDRFFGFLGGAINFFTGEDCAPLLSGNNYMRLNRDVYEVPQDFYATDAFTDYALQFLREKQEDKPFFLYIAYNAPHFPLQAPEKEISKYMDVYAMGWDKHRKKRHERMIEMGLIDLDWGIS